MKKKLACLSKIFSITKSHMRRKNTANHLQRILLINEEGIANKRRDSYISSLILNNVIVNLKEKMFDMSDSMCIFLTARLASRDTNQRLLHYTTNSTAHKSVRCN